MPGRWADTEEDKAADLQRKREKEEKRRLKAEKARHEAEAAAVSRRQHEEQRDAARPAKRARTEDPEPDAEGDRPLLRYDAPTWGPCRSVDNFERLNHIEEGSYGWVSRARELGSGTVVALKKLKMDGPDGGQGFPVTGLREIQCLMAARHRHIVDLREVVVGPRLDDVYIVMDFVEHDLKTLQEEMEQPFRPSEIKTLLLQLGSAVEFLHSHWILHRDIKTSNILMNNKGEIKVADFGMARYFGDPPPKMTQLVVTLWYRAPELLLGTERYGTAVDIWSVGCIFGELLTKEPLFQSKNEVDALTKVFELCGVPTEESWPDFKRLPNAKGLRLHPSKFGKQSLVRSRFPDLTDEGAALLIALLALNPDHRPSAADMLQHPYFLEQPRPKPTSMFPTFPSKAGQERRRRAASPPAPRRGDAPKLHASEADVGGILASRAKDGA